MGSLIERLLDLHPLPNATKILIELGIQTQNSDGSYRMLADILEELSEIWNELTEQQKDYITSIGEDSNEE